MTIEENRAVYDFGPEAVIALVQRLEAITARQQEEITALQAVISAQAEKITALEARIKQLEERLATNSRNSSKPPSSDGPGGKPHPKSQRSPSGRKPGGQPGHVGHTLAMVDKPDDIRVHAPFHCRGCGRDLEQVPMVCRERRQVVELPPVKAHVIEH